MELFRLSEQNRWWEDDRTLLEDPHIRALRDSPVNIVHPLENRMDLHDDRIYILRGPRQVGKTTLLKKLIKTLVDQGMAPSRILYFAFDIGGMRDDRDVLDLVKTYLTWATSRAEGRLWLFLDEVTYTPDWSTGIKAAFDLNLLNNVTVIATGSSSLDLRRGGERLPGRRGEKPEENDLTMLPLSFRSLLKSVSPEVDIPAFDSLSPEHVYTRSLDLSFYGEQTSRVFDTYLLTGGYPLPIVSYQRDSSVEVSVFHTYLQAILGDLAKGGKSEIYARELVNALISKRFEPVNWQMISQMTSIGSHNTVSDYVEFLEAMYVLKLLYQVRSLGGGEPSFRKRRKVYFLDPFTHHTLDAWRLGSSSPIRNALSILEDSQRRSRIVEGIVGTHLSPLFSHLLFWRNRGEIDFICLEERKPLAYVEVKYQAVVTPEDRKWLKKVGGGILLSRDRLEYDSGANIATVPAAYFLAGLAET